MIKAAAIAFWGVLLVAGSTYYFSLASAPAGKEEPVATKRLEVFTLDTTSIPIIRNNEIRGYLLISAAFTLSSDVVGKLPFPVDYQIRDGVFEALFSDREFDIFQLDKLDIEKTKNEMKQRINGKYPDLVEDIKLRMLDFMTKDEVRDMQMRRY